MPHKAFIRKERIGALHSSTEFAIGAVKRLKGERVPVSPQVRHQAKKARDKAPEIIPKLFWHAADYAVFCE